MTSRFPSPDSRFPDFSALAQPSIQRLRAYDPGHDLVAFRRRFADAPLIELGSNENPYGPSARAKEAVLGTIHDSFRYPDPLGGDLKRALAAKYGVEVASILLGNGTHELLMQFAQVFAGPGVEVVASKFGFAVYAIAAQCAGADLRVAACNTDDHAMPRGHDLDAIAAAVTPATRLIYLANPNNPTGTWYGADAFATFMAKVPSDVVVVVDEAYAEFVDAPEWASALALLPQHPNLVVTRTFSKAYALAGLRVGFAIAHPGLIAVMERVRESFNVNSAGLAAAEAALGDDEHLQWVVERNREQRDALTEALHANGLRVFPSQTNFLLTQFVEPGEEARVARIDAALIDRGVVLRPMGGYGLGHCLRITVGNPDENRRLLAALDEVLA
ncbi:MAG: histidinol-phosphate transaminase [Lysobacter sp.]|nr:histidinol-phosphate transaminase [Lysobacter sp.]